MAEEIYQQSLEIELRLRNLPYLTQAQLEVFYKNNRLETKYIPDLMVFGEIVAELKAVKELLLGPITSTTNNGESIGNCRSARREPNSRGSTPKLRLDDALVLTLN